MALVVVDPGHASPDPGAVANGVREADYNLAICLKFEAALKRCGINVIMTRTTDRLPLGENADISADLTYRAHLANEAKADLFVSWHADSSKDTTVNGLAVWIYPAAAGTRTQARAQALADAITTATSQKNNGVKTGDFAVLRETTMDAVLIEGDFISNLDSAKKLFDESFQRKQAEAATRSVCNMLGVTYTAPPSTDTLLDPVAANICIAQLQAVTKTAIKDVVVGINFAANAIRRDAELPITTDLGKPTQVAAKIVEKLMQTFWACTDNPAVRSCWHTGADASRAAQV